MKILDNLIGYLKSERQDKGVVHALENTQDALNLDTKVVVRWGLLVLILGGGGFVSRLTEQVREKRGLSYSVYSAFAPGLHAGAFTVGLQTRPDQAKQAVAVAQEVVQGFVRQGPTEAELQAAKSNLVGGFALRIDSNRKLLDNVANIAWNRLPLDYLNTWTRQIERVSAADVQRAMARVLQPERMVTVVVGAN